MIDTYYELVGENTRENVINALTEMAQHDWDFCGENGEEYTWDAAKRAGFKTTLDYVLDSLEDEDNLYQLIIKFMDALCQDYINYAETDYTIITDTEENDYKILAIVFVLDYWD